MNILLIEDYQFDKDLIMEMLSSVSDFTFKLTHETRFKKGLEHFDNSDFDIILLDLNLPDSKGFVTVVRAIETKTKVPIIVLTGNENKEIGISAVKEGVQDYIVKGSITGEVMVEKLKYAIERQKLVIELEKLNSVKNRFFSIISHDIKSPLNVLSGFTNILKTEFDDLDTDEVKNYVNILDKTTNQLVDFISNLLNWGKLNMNKSGYSPKNIELKKIINDIIKLYTDNAAKKKISLFCSIQNEIEVYADRDMISSIIRNLISNAIKYTEVNGKIEIEYEDLGDFVKISVVDNGIGIKSSDIENILKLDDLIKKNGTDGESGTGLGLIISNEFIKENGGKLNIKSEENKGSTFEFTLPKNK